MEVAFVIAILVACILLFFFILQKTEIKNITNQLQEIRKSDTNVLLHSQNGTADKLIDQVNMLLKDMHDIKTAYNRKNHTLEQMMTNISHDLRTPLTSAMGYIDLIRYSELSEEEKDRELAIIEKRLTRLEELINAFFEMSRIVSNGKEPEKADINIISVLEESIAHYYDDFSDKNRQIIFECDYRRLMVCSNQEMLLRIFDNLIGNALKHGIGDLTINVEKIDEIKITFQNELVSPDIDIEHIFDEFYTTDISRTKGSTGLGLAIAKEFTEMLGEKIEASLCGDFFYIYLILHEQK